MKKMVLVFMTLALIVMVEQSQAANSQTGYANDPYAAQIALDSFNYSVRKRFESIRMGSFQQGFASAPLFRSDDAWAKAPSSRRSSVSGVSSRRQLDCVYYNGFTIWGDLYSTWASQKNYDNNNGYKFDTIGPAIGFDWTSSAFTVGVATTYAWGTLDTRSMNHKQDVDTWGVQGYAQYNAEKFYVNSTIGYGHNRYKSTRQGQPGPGWHSSKYSSNSFNLDLELGMKFNFQSFLVTPHAGLRFFHDRRSAINESLRASPERYHVLELPLGANFGYPIHAGGALIIPQLKAAWIPELARKRGHASYSNGWSDDSAKRARNGFLLGAGIEAKLSKSLSMHVDYNCNMRNNAYAHHLNLGAGFTF